jgi:hypothetical protein
MSYRFSYGHAASNLYYTENGIEYTMTFDYSYDSLYFRKNNSNLLNLNLLSSSWNFELLDRNDKIIFKSMLEKTYQETKNFTFSNIPNLIKELLKLKETIST